MLTNVLLFSVICKAALCTESQENNAEFGLPAEMGRGEDAIPSKDACYTSSFLQSHTTGLSLPAALDEVKESEGTPSGLTFLLRTGGPDSSERIQAIKDTWGHSLSMGPSGQIVPFVPDNECLQTYGDNHGRGLTCLEAKNELSVAARGDFTWLLIIDDDVYVNVKNLQHALGNLDPAKSSVYGIKGCGHCEEDRGGLCGGGGYLISRQNLQELTSQKKVFVGQFNSEPDQEWCDVRFACTAQMHGLTLESLEGLYGWAFDTDALEDKAVYSTDVLPLTFHYAGPGPMGRMRTLHAKFESAADLLELPAGISVAEYWSMQQENIRLHNSNMKKLQEHRSKVNEEAASILFENEANISKRS